MALSPRRCTVINPSGVTTSATRLNRYFQYPQEFENAPPVRPGLYRFRLEGQLTNGEWVDITSGKHEVQPPPALVVKILDDSMFENWKYIALIAALHVQVQNTTSMSIQVSGYAYIGEDGPGWEDLATGEEIMSIRREISRRDETQHHGQPLRLFARIAPDQTISGWFLTPVNRPSASGIPACTVIVKDNVGNQYRATFPAREPQVYGS